MISDKYFRHCLQQEVWEGAAGRGGRSQGHSNDLLCTVFIVDPEQQKMKRRTQQNNTPRKRNRRCLQQDP